jgi:hypothetical protein
VSDRKIIESWVRNAYMYHTFHNKTPMQVIQNLQDLMETHKNQELFFRHEESEEFLGQYTINVYERREENDREYKARLAKELKDKDDAGSLATIKKEFEEYQRLKKKFEDVE